MILTKCPMKKTVFAKKGDENNTNERKLSLFFAFCVDEDLVGHCLRHRMNQIRKHLASFSCAKDVRLMPAVPWLPSSSFVFLAFSVEG